jgi:hypothetical protein
LLISFQKGVYIQASNHDTVGYNYNKISINMLYKNNYLHKLLILTIIGSLFLFSGCATILKGTHDEINMHSKPPAKVYINGSYRGDTPIKLQLKTKKEYNIKFKTKGYKTKTIHINNSVGAGWIVLDVVLGLVPVVVDAATGAWHKLDQKTVNAVLQKQH